MDGETKFVLGAIGAVLALQYTLGIIGYMAGWRDFPTINPFSAGIDCETQICKR
jgi:hypothetical protein